MSECLEKDVDLVVYVCRRNNGKYGKQGEKKGTTRRNAK